LVQLGVVQHGSYAREADLQHTLRSELRPARGRIMDRTGRVLAEDLERCGLTARPRALRGDTSVVSLLASALDTTQDAVRARLASHPTYVRLARSLQPDAERRLKDAHIPGLDLTREMSRVYSYGSLAVSVLGRTDVDGRGVEGLELAYNGELRGAPGWATVVRDGRGGVYPSLSRTVRRPEDGYGLVLTLDATYQTIVEDELAHAVAEHNAKGATCIIVEPHTGDILAMASVDGPTAAHTGPPRNRAIADQFEPGSTFKLVVSSGAIEEHVVTATTPIFCENGSMNFGGFTIHDAHRHGTLAFKDVIAQSSNIGSAKVGLMLGSTRLYNYARAYGFGRPTGIDLPGEATGHLRPTSLWSGRSTPTVAIGQEVSVTPLQLAMAYAAVANDGVLMTPRIVRSLVHPDGSTVRANPPRVARRVVSVETARTVRSFLAAVVDSGTATTAQLSWARAGGKTGTAQQYDPATGTYGHGKFLSSFVGMVPVDRPSLVCLVMVDEPTGQHYGGLVAAPVWKRIVETIGRLPGAPVAPSFRRLGADARVQADGREVTPMPAQLAERAALAGVRPAPASTPLSPAPSSRVSAPADTSEGAAYGSRMPDLVGVPLRDALRALRTSAARVSASGAGVVLEQMPAPGAPLRAGDGVVLRCGSNREHGGRSAGIRSRESGDRER
jgi:cell division protein FtsI (penicillin-binding protein 3)